MKKNLLIILLGLISMSASAQTEKRSPQVSVFPNPATDYITLNDDDAVRNITILNMVGRKIRIFNVEKGERYEIGDLPNGLYFVQIIGKNSKVLTTQRLTKKS